MKTYTHDYTICKENSPGVFRAFCKKLDKITKNFEKGLLLTDAAGSTVQTYAAADGRRIAVYCDYDVGAVHMRTNFDPNQMFEWGME